jgi:hypothetical protein
MPIKMKLLYLYIIISLCFSCQQKSKDYVLHNNSIQYWDIWNIEEEKGYLKPTAYSYSFDKNGECLSYSYWYVNDKEDSVERIRNDHEHPDVVRPKIWNIQGDTINLRGELVRYNHLNNDIIYLAWGKDWGQLLIRSPMQKIKGKKGDFVGLLPFFR